MMEEYPLMSQFQNSDSPKELVERCEAIFEARNDNFLYKGEDEPKNTNDIST